VHAVLEDACHTWEICIPSTLLAPLYNFLHSNEYQHRNMKHDYVLQTMILFEEHMLNIRENKLHVYRWKHGYFNYTTLWAQSVQQMGLNIMTALLLTTQQKLEPTKHWGSPDNIPTSPHYTAIPLAAKTKLGDVEMPTTCSVMSHRHLNGLYYISPEFETIEARTHKKWETVIFKVSSSVAGNEISDVHKHRNLCLPHPPSD